MSLLKCTLLTVLFTLLHSAAFAQLPADQGFLIKSELDKRGLTEAEAQSALAEQSAHGQLRRAAFHHRTILSHARPP